VTSKLRQQIIEADDIQTEQVPVPEWGVTVEMRGMDGHARAKYMEMFRDEDSGRINYQALYPTAIIECTFDPETGERVFEDGDQDFINQKSGKALERVASVAMQLSGMSEESEAEAGNDSRVNTENDGSTSTSPEN